MEHTEAPDQLVLVGDLLEISSTRCYTPGWI